MPRAAFVIGPGDHQVMEVNPAWWGGEEYYLNGELLLRRWSLFGGVPREFRIGERLVCIALCSNGNEYFGRVFVDGELYIEELSPQLAAMAGAARQPSRCLAAALSGALAGLPAAALVALWRCYAATP